MKTNNIEKLEKTLDFKPCKTHKGVNIYKVYSYLVGSDIKELKDGSMKYCKPQFDMYYMICGGYPNDTKQECINDINDLYSKCTFDKTYTEKDFIDIMNEDIETLNRYYSKSYIDNWKELEQYAIL